MLKEAYREFSGFYYGIKSNNDSDVYFRLIRYDEIRTIKEIRVISSPPTPPPCPSIPLICLECYGLSAESGKYANRRFCNKEAIEVKNWHRDKTIASQIRKMDGDVQSSSCCLLLRSLKVLQPKTSKSSILSMYF